MIVLVVVPTGDKKAQAHDVAKGITIFNGLRFITSDNLIATGNSMLAVAEVLINSITKFATTDIDPISTGTGKIAPNWDRLWPTTSDKPEDCILSKW